MQSSYKDEKNYAVNSSMLSREFDLTGRTGCALSFEQAFGFVAPQAQDEKFVLKVREAGGEWYPLVMTNLSCSSPRRATGQNSW